MEKALLFKPYLQKSQGSYHESYQDSLHYFLAECGDSIKEPLLNASRSENWKIRWESLYYLSRINDSECRERLQELADDPVYGVRMKSRMVMR